MVQASTHSSRPGFLPSARGPALGSKLTVRIEVVNPLIAFVTCSYSNTCSQGAPAVSEKTLLSFCLVSPDSTTPSHQSRCQQTAPPRRAEHQGRGSGPPPTNPPGVTRPPARPAPPREASRIQRAETEVSSWCCSKSEYKRNVLHLHQAFGREVAFGPQTPCNHRGGPCALLSTGSHRTGRTAARQEVPEPPGSPRERLWGRGGKEGGDSPTPGGEVGDQAVPPGLCEVVT